MKLTDEADLATDILGITPKRAAELRREHQWPHVRLGRTAVRYTDEQIDAVVAMQSVAAGAPKQREAAPVIGGQTARSRRRSA